MLTRHQIYSEIGYLESVGQIRAYSNNERVKLARLHICRRYLELCDEKNTAIDRGETLSWNYDKQILMQIRDILILSRDNWALETDEQRKGSLHNLVRAALLLRRSFTSIYNVDYLVQGARAQEINLWRNLQFLIQYQITPQVYGVIQPLRISSADINDLLRELFGLLDTVLAREIRIGLRIQPIYGNLGDDLYRLPLDMRNLFQRHDHEVRRVYRDPHHLPLLQALCAYGREKLRISKMLEAIRFARTLDVGILVGKMAFLRQLQIIGELSTGKNFSAATKQLRQDIDWQLLVRLRNKLSHNEWDIHSGLLNTAVKTAILQAIQRDLAALEASVKHLQLDDHNPIGEKRNRILRHYGPAWYLMPEARLLFLDFIRDCYIPNLINRTQLFQLRNLIVGNIRNIALPIVIKGFIAPIFNHVLPRDPVTRDLPKRYEFLIKAFNKDICYHRNQENPDGRMQKRIAFRLKAHQVNIRAFHDLLNYSQDTYNQDRQNHRFSFNSLRLTGLIKAEIIKIQDLLHPLPGSSSLSLDYPEDTTIIPHAELMGTIFNIINYIYGQAAPSTQSAIRDIQAYCMLIQKPLYLELEGLHGVRRGEVGRLDPQTLLQNVPNLLEPIKRFGSKCSLYISLAHHPEIVEACFYHMARIQKYVMVLKLSGDVNEDLLPNFEEFKALRNFIHHGIDLFETMDIKPLEFMARYASMLINTLLPSINRIEADILERPNLNVLLLQHGIYRKHTVLVGQDLHIPDPHRARSLSF